ncbi:MAG: hypothetical protein AAGF97_09220 [Planctomycetota bacterium]
MKQNVITPMILLMFNMSMSIPSGLAANLIGDTIPEFYYFPTDGLSVKTSFGTITRPAGTLTVDTNGLDLQLVQIDGLEPKCDLCTGDQLPLNDGLGQVSTWNFVYFNSIVEWAQNVPLPPRRAFAGVIGTGFIDDSGEPQPWPDDVPPFNNFPMHGLGNYGPNLSEQDFPRGFLVDGERFNVQYSIRDGQLRPLGTNITIVPEPNGGSWLLTLAMGAAALRHRSRQRTGTEDGSPRHRASQLP